MTRLSSGPLVGDQETIRASAVSRTTLILTAWTSTLLLSKLPLLIARDLLGTDIPWITPAWVGIAALLFASTYIWQGLRPLRGYFLALGVIYLLTLLDPFVRQMGLWQSSFGTQSQMVMLFGDRVLLVLYALVVLAALLLIGVKRGDIFLAVGDLNAPAGGKASAGRRPLSWKVLGTAVSLLLGGLFFGFLVSQCPGVLSRPGALLPGCPLSF